MKFFEAYNLMNENTVVDSDEKFEMMKSKGKSGIAVAKPVTLEFRIASQPETVQTLEGPEQAPAGAVIMKGVVGEEYAIDPNKFPQKYKNITYSNPEKTAGHATKIVSAEGVEFVDPMQPFGAKTWAGVIQGDENDVLVRYGQGDYGIIKKQVNGQPLFTQLYHVKTT